MSCLRANSRLNGLLGGRGVAFLNHAVGAIERILPHVNVSRWVEGGWDRPGAHFTSQTKRELRVRVALGTQEDGRSLTASVSRLQPKTHVGEGTRTIDLVEKDICSRIALAVSQILNAEVAEETKAASLAAIEASFDEHIVSGHVAEHTAIAPVIPRLFATLHRLAEQTYENKSLAFGCIVDTNIEAADADRPLFPEEFLRLKRYRALSDGYKTAYRMTGDGELRGFEDLDAWLRPPMKGEHWFPEWAEALANASRDGCHGVALTRQGDLLVFENGTLRFSYRFGRWQYWNHAHLVHALRSLCRVQRVAPKRIGRVVGALYRTALDVSFRRSGGLLVVLRKRDSLRDVVREGDAVGDHNRGHVDSWFDDALPSTSLLQIPRSVLVELASLDGAVVVDNTGRLLAYGAVLNPKKKGRVRGSEGARTKAAIGASEYGLALKTSSDGDITAYSKGEPVFTV